MLEDPRSTLIDVALEAGFFIAFGLVDHVRPRRHPPGGVERAVRIMAIRTLDHAFIHTMLERHGELRPDARVAGVTQLGLLLFGE